MLLASKCMNPSSFTHALNAQVRGHEYGVTTLDLVTPLVAEEHAFADDPLAQSHAQAVLNTILTFVPQLIADLMPRGA